MPRSNFTILKEGCTIGGLGLDIYSHGRHFYVCNSATLAPYGQGGSDSNKGNSPQQPFATIGEAVTQAALYTVSGNPGAGDVIVLLPGHSETISSATALSLSVQGLTIVGIGNGNDRPNVTLDTAATSTINVTANNISIYNVQFTPNFASITSLFTLTTAKYFKLSDCRINTGSSVNFLSVVTTSVTSNNNDGLTVESCYWAETSTSTLSLIALNGTQDKVTLNDNYVDLGVHNSTAGGIIQASGKIITNLSANRNRVIRLNTTNTGLLISTASSTNTGLVADNYCEARDASNLLIVTASSGYSFFNNMYAGTADKSGLLEPPTS